MALEWLRNTMKEGKRRWRIMQLVGVLEGIHLHSRNVKLEDEHDSLHSFKQISTQDLSLSLFLSLCVSHSLSLFVFLSYLRRWEAAFGARFIHYF